MRRMATFAPPATNNIVVTLLKQQRIMQTNNNKQTWQTIIKIVIAVLSAILGAIGANAVSL
jgi:uncharacterized integral membrane protein